MCIYKHEGSIRLLFKKSGRRGGTLMCDFLEMISLMISVQFILSKKKAIGLITRSKESCRVS
jgi:hypothetical protein